MRRVQSTVRPLLIRPGSRFSCTGDGMCCTDIHILGPLTSKEAQEMRRIDPASVAYNKDVEGIAFCSTAQGACYNICSDGCRVHKQHGFRAKPSGCRRFPFGLVATPHGGRITTEHRCPGRAIGKRPVVTIRQAERFLKDGSGRLQADKRIENRIQLSKKRSISFGRYAEIERQILTQLSHSRNPLKILDAEPFPRLTESSWPVFAAEFFEFIDGTACGEALAWFGDALLSLTSGHQPPPRKRPWKKHFQKQLRGSQNIKKTSLDVFNDWIADEIWMFRAIEWGPFDAIRAELATRYIVARKIQKRIQSQGVSAVQAAAEAVMLAEIAIVSEQWSKIIEKFDLKPN